MTNVAGSEKVKTTSGIHEITAREARAHDERVPVSPMGTEGCQWEDDDFDYEALMPRD